MKLSCLASLYQLDGILDDCRVVEAMPKSFTDPHVG
jgi:hypothetical protein